MCPLLFYGVLMRVFAFESASSLFCGYGEQFKRICINVSHRGQLSNVSECAFNNFGYTLLRTAYTDEEGDPFQSFLANATIGNVIEFVELTIR